VDTCCINKQSSVDLSEAINSMCSWYNSAIRWYVDLENFEIGKGINSFRCSRWFTRGWTSQRLIAPPVISFYDCTLPDAYNWDPVHEGSRVCRENDHNGPWAPREHRLTGLDVGCPSTTEVNRGHLGFMWTYASQTKGSSSTFSGRRVS
jgi:hypothetical protein